MSKLYVRRGKKGTPFHPRIQIVNTGFSDNQVCMQFFKAECQSCGEDPMPLWRKKHGEHAVAAMVAYYFAELRRTGHVEIMGPSTRPLSGYR